MLQQVMNFSSVASLLTPPNNWQWGELYNADRKNLRYGWNCPDNAKGLIVIAEGRSEVIEEYFESIRDLNEQGYACAIMDWQGHGMSYRYYDDNSRHHSEGFDKDTDDFRYFLSELDLNPELQGLPKILFAHSMGANITMRYLEDHADAFNCALMVAPMLGLRPKRFIKYFGKAILSTISKLGWHDHYAPGQTPWSEAFSTITKVKVSSDTIRRDVQPYLFKTRPELQCGGVTYGWVKEALRSIHHLHDPDTAKKIVTPIFMSLAGRDIVVDNEGACKTASYRPDCTMKTYPNAQHQLHRECDTIRDEFMEDMFNFIERHLSTPS